MAYRSPPSPAKGTRHAGSGRKPGTPNKISVEAHALASQLVNDPDYQRRLREDFRLRKVHPTIESLIWNYHLGKPRQPIEVNGQIDVSARLETERRIFCALDVRELEQLAAESQALVDRAEALARTRADAPPPQHVVGSSCLPEVSAETLEKQAGSDNTRYVNDGLAPDEEPGSPTDTEG